jgi:hypothetical protein
MSMFIESFEKFICLCGVGETEKWWPPDVRTDCLKINIDGGLGCYVCSN